MNRKIKLHKFKRQLKNFILVALMVTALMFCVCSLAHLLLMEFKAMVSFVISLTMLVLFGVANKGAFV